MTVLQISGQLNANISTLSAIEEVFMLDKRIYCDIIIFTIMSAVLTRRRYDKAQTRFIQDKNAQRAWHSQSSSRKSLRPAFSTNAVLRPSRSASGQVRDASARARRGAFGGPRSTKLWLVSAVVLPGVQKLFAPRARGAFTFQIRSSSCAQALPISCRFHHLSAKRQSLYKGEKPGCSYRAPVPHPGPSQKHRARAQAFRKKNLITTDYERKCSLGDEPLAERYENLRVEILSGTYRLDRASGLGTLLCLGLCAWMNGAQSHLSDKTDWPPQYSASQIQPLHRQLGSVIADMLIA
jgi:hypothetical protein